MRMRCAQVLAPVKAPKVEARQPEQYDEHVRRWQAWEAALERCRKYWDNNGPIPRWAL